MTIIQLEVSADMRSIAPILALLYLVMLDLKRGGLLRLEMIPMRRQYFRLNHANRKDSDWLRTMLDRESRLLGARVTPSGNATLQLHWT